MALCFFSSRQKSPGLLVVVIIIIIILMVHDGLFLTSSAVDASTVSVMPNRIHNHKDDQQQQQQQQPQQPQRQLPYFARLPRRLRQQRPRFHVADWQRLVHGISRRGQATLTHSIPALSVYSRRQQRQQDDDTKRRNRRGPKNHQHDLLDHDLVEVAVKEKASPQKNQPPHPRRSKRKPRQWSLPNPMEVTTHLFDHAGFYYGIDPKSLDRLDHSSNTTDKNKNLKRQRPPKLLDSMNEALEELRMLREEVDRMRKEVHTLKLKMVGEDDDDQDDDQERDSEEIKTRKRIMLRKKQKEAERLAAEIEVWAQQMLQEGEDEGWKPVECNKVIRGSLNQGDRTTAYLKWMKDSRADNANKEDNTDYPCIKCYSTIDAPLEDVCTYLSQEAVSADYNDVVEKHKDVEEISPSAKICWSQSPQILFIKPRDFVTFCHHRWKNDGTEVIVNQAWDHPNFPLEEMEKEGKSCRGYALRGANFLSRCPEDPSKTQITIIAHANPGGGLPQWAAKTAVNALAPIEPFKLFHKINENVKRNQPELRERLKEAEMVSTMPPGRSPRPGGFAQLGYACFWPNGGGNVDGGFKKPGTSDSLVVESTDSVDAVGDDTGYVHGDSALDQGSDDLSESQSEEDAIFAVDPESS